LTPAKSSYGRIFGKETVFRREIEFQVPEPLHLKIGKYEGSVQGKLRFLSDDEVQHGAGGEVERHLKP